MTPSTYSLQDVLLAIREAVEEEREACARLVTPPFGFEVPYHTDWTAFKDALARAASAIRARSKEGKE